MTPFQRNAYRAALAAAVMVGLMGTAWLALAQPAPVGIKVSTPEREEASLLPVPTPTPIAGALVNINAAGRAELEQLPRIGEVLADRIVEYRNANGPYLRTDHLMAVRGIGPTIYEAIRDLISTGK